MGLVRFNESHNINQIKQEQVNIQNDEGRHMLFHEVCFLLFLISPVEIQYVILINLLELTVKNRWRGDEENYYETNNPKCNSSEKEKASGAPHVFPKDIGRLCRLLNLQYHILVL